MGNVVKPSTCPDCNQYAYSGNIKPLYERGEKGFKRIGWLFPCGHASFDKKKEEAIER